MYHLLIAELKYTASSNLQENKEIQLVLPDMNSRGRTKYSAWIIFFLFHHLSKFIKIDFSVIIAIHSCHNFLCLLLTSN